MIRYTVSVEIGKKCICTFQKSYFYNKIICLFRESDNSIKEEKQTYVLPIIHYLFAYHIIYLKAKEKQIHFFNSEKNKPKWNYTYIVIVIFILTTRRILNAVNVFMSDAIKGLELVKKSACYNQISERGP